MNTFVKAGIISWATFLVGLPLAGTVVVWNLVLSSLI